jgi:5'-phosphate synthase pdxT subunit
LVSVARVGILALQGDFAAHAAVLSELQVRPVEVRRCAQLDSIDGLIIPGGESTTLLNLMEDEPWFDALRGFHAGGRAIFGTCAGAILLAREVLGPSQPSLGLLDVVVRRNGYGRQVDSFEEAIELSGDTEPLRAVFIRAPRFEQVGEGVEVCAKRQGEPVLVRQGRLMAGTFHPELTDDRRLHLRFLELMRENENDWTLGLEAHAVSGCGS